MAQFTPMPRGMATNIPISLVASLRVQNEPNVPPDKPRLRRRPLRPTDSPIISALPALPPLHGGRKVRNPGEAGLRSMRHVQGMTCKTKRPFVLTTARSGAVFSKLLLAGAMLLGPGWGVPRCAAQSFPSMLTDEQTFSIGVVQVVVDPSFAFLFAPAPTY